MILLNWTKPVLAVVVPLALYAGQVTVDYVFERARKKLRRTKRRRPVTKKKRR